MTESLARNTFLISLAALEEATEIGVIRETSRSAALIRKGLTVTAFNILEGFIFNRWTEFAEFLNRSSLAFSDLPEDTRREILKRTLMHASSKLKWADLTGEKLESFIAPLAGQFAMESNRSIISQYSATSGGSNVSGADIKSSLALLGAEDPWGQMTDFTGRCGLSSTGPDGQIVNLEVIYKHLSNARNSAAHDPTSEISFVELRSLAPQVRQIALGYDLVGTAAALDLSLRSQRDLSGNKISKRRYNINNYTIRHRKKDAALFRPKSGSNLTCQLRTWRAGDKKYIRRIASASLRERDVLLEYSIDDALLSWECGYF